MGKLDKDRYLKQLALRVCIERGVQPFLEVAIHSSSDLSDSPELLTDIDVLGVGQRANDPTSLTIFDCKSSSKLSPINRAFWAAGLRDYVGADDAFVLMNNRATKNHKLSALVLNVELHDEASFTSYGQTLNPVFPSGELYQYDIGRWQSLEDAYRKNSWAQSIKEISGTKIPLSRAPWAEFRKVVSALRASRGYFDPTKAEHLGIYFDILSSSLVTWATMSRDLRRIYDPKTSRAEFETLLRYYLWGGKESYTLRQQLSDRSGADAKPLELPSWNSLVKFAGLTLDSPQSLMATAFLCKEIALRYVSGSDIALDSALRARVADNNRILQFASALSGYLVPASSLPTDLAHAADAALFAA